MPDWIIQNGWVTQGALLVLTGIALMITRSLWYQPEHKNSALQNELLRASYVACVAALIVPAVGWASPRVGWVLAILITVLLIWYGGSRCRNWRINVLGGRYPMGEL